jgi:hypothetical protein
MTATKEQMKVGMCSSVFLISTEKETKCLYKLVFPQRSGEIKENSRNNGKPPFLEVVCCMFIRSFIGSQSEFSFCETCRGAKRKCVLVQSCRA